MCPYMTHIAFSLCSDLGPSVIHSSIWSWADLVSLKLKHLCPEACNLKHGLELPRVSSKIKDSWLPHWVYSLGPKWAKVSAFYASSTSCLPLLPWVCCWPTVWTTVTSGNVSYLSLLEEQHTKESELQDDLQTLSLVLRNCRFNHCSSTPT